MASGPYFDPRRGTWSVQWFDGIKWCRTVVVRKQPGWKPGGVVPKKAPPAAVAALGDYTRKEQDARARKAPTEGQTISLFLQAYREAYLPTHAVRSGKELDKAIKQFLGWCGRNGVNKVAEITPAVCHRWLVDRGASIQRDTLAKERAMIAAAWSQAFKRDEIGRNPWSSAPVPGKPTKKKRGSWTPEQYQKLLEVCRPWLRDLLILGCNTGLRIGALMGLEWRDVHWARHGEKGFGWVEVRPELDKAKKGYRVPMNETCHDLLARIHLHKEADATFVLTGDQGRPIKCSSTTDASIRLACERAGLRKPDSPNHHTRRTFGRWAVLGHLTGRPVPLYVVSKWLGHASIVMTERYLDMRHDDSTRFMLGENDDDDQVT